MELDVHSADFVAGALMPDEKITLVLVKKSAENRLSDFYALSTLTSFLPLNERLAHTWKFAPDYLKKCTDTHQMAVRSSPLFRRWVYRLGRSIIQGAPRVVLEPLLNTVGNYISDFNNAEDPDLLPIVTCNEILETWDCRWGGDGPWQPVAATATTATEILLPESNIPIRNDLPGLRVSLDETRIPERADAVREHLVDLREEAYPSDPAQLLSRQHKYC